MKTMKVAALSAAMLMGLGAGSAHAVVIDWVDWTSASAGSASGTLGGGTVSVGYTGGYAFVQNGVTGNLANYWSEGIPAPYTNNPIVDNAPTAAEGISLSTAGTKTITFSEAVVNPVFAFNSWNGGSQGADFGTPINILSTGLGSWGSGTVVPGFGGNGFLTTSGEPHGVLQLPGTFTSITFTDQQNENWHGFTIGIEGVADGITPAPEPATLSLFGIGLAGLGVMARRRRARYNPQTL